MGSKAKPQTMRRSKPTPFDGFLGGLFDQVRPDGAVLGADADRDAFERAVFFGVFAGGVEPQAGVGFKAVELEALLLAGVLHAGGLEVVEDHVLELAEAAFLLPVHLGAGALLLGGEHAVGGEAFDGEGAGDADALVVLVGLIVEQLGLGAASNGGVDFGLALLAKGPPGGMEIDDF